MGGIATARKILNVTQQNCKMGCKVLLPWHPENRVWKALYIKRNSMSAAWHRPLFLLSQSRLFPTHIFLALNAIFLWIVAWCKHHSAPLANRLADTVIEHLRFKLFIKGQYRPFEILTEQGIRNDLRTFAIKTYTLSVHEVCAHTTNELIRTYSLLRTHLYQATHRRSDGFVVMSL